MINKRNLIIVVIASILIGVWLFKLNSPKVIPPTKTSTQALDIPQDNPGLPPINENSNLKEEIEKLTPPAYTEDFKQLRESI